MSIDYDQLREQLHITTEREYSRAPWQVGNEDNDGFFDVRDTDYNVVAWRMTRREAELVAMLPDIARELLRLRDGVEVIRDRCAGLGLKAEYAPNVPAQTAYREAEQLLTDLLNGDTE